MGNLADFISENQLFRNSQHILSGDAASKCFRIVYPDEDGNEAVTFTDAVFECRTGPGFVPDLASFNSQLELCESRVSGLSRQSRVSGRSRQYSLFC